MDRRLLRLRAATADDAAFVAAMAAEALFWRSGCPPDGVARLLADAQTAHYAAGWPLAGDAGVIAESSGEPVGAAWFRLLSAADPGYGYVDDVTPEVSIGVLPGFRGQGIGRLLMRRLIETARAAGLSQLSLSVEADNYALALYRDLGFSEVARPDNSPTMVLTL